MKNSSLYLSQSYKDAWDDYNCSLKSATFPTPQKNFVNHSQNLQDDIKKISSWRFILLSHNKDYNISQNMI